MSAKELYNIQAKYIVVENKEIYVFCGTVSHDVFSRRFSGKVTGAGKIVSGKCSGESFTLNIGVGEDDQEFLDIFITKSFN